MKKRIFLAFFLSSLLMLGVGAPSAFAAFGDSVTWMSKSYTGDGEDRLDAYFDFARDVVVNSSGDFLIADTFNNVIRKIGSSSQTVSTIAGTGSYGFTDGDASKAEFANPSGVAVDPNRNIYVADTNNNAIRKISAGKVTTLTRDVKAPEGVVVVGSNVYIADTGSGMIKKVSARGGTVSVVTDDTKQPKKLAVSEDEKWLYVADAGRYQVVKVNISTGQVVTVSGSGTKGYKEGSKSSARFQNLWGMTRDGDMLYVSDGNGFTDYVRSVDPDTGETELLSSDAAMVSINFPAGLDVKDNKLYVANSGLSTIHEFDLDNPNINAIYAGKNRFQDENGSRTNALLGRPWDIVLSKDRSTMYIAENNLVKKYEFGSNNLSFIAGSVIDSYREGQATRARFSNITSIAVDSAEENLYVTDRWNNKIRKIDLDTKEATTLAGGGQVNTDGADDNGYLEGKGEDARFNHPGGVVMSPDDKYLYVTDAGNNRIRRVKIADGTTSLVAGSGIGGFVNGGKTAARFNRPWGIAIDSVGKYLYVADSNNHAIRRVTISTGDVVTVAGTGKAGYREGVGAAAFFSVPEYVEWSSDGYLYVTEVGGARVRRIALSTNTTSLVSGDGAYGYVNGARDKAEFQAPKGLTIDSRNKKLYIADSSNDVIRRIELFN